MASAHPTATDPAPSASPERQDRTLDMAAYLQGLAAEGPIYYLANPGNAGDSMIAHATYRMFERHGIDYRLIDRTRFDAAGKIVLFGGGGSMIGDPNIASAFVAEHHQQARKFVVLPHTSQGHIGMLSCMGSNVELIAREKETLQHLRQHAPAAKVMIAHDLAFSFDADDLLAAGGGPIHADFHLKRLARRHFMRMAEALRRGISGVDTIHCFRTDKEQTDQARPKSNADLSKLFKCGVATPRAAARSTWMVFDMLRHYREIHTNRLHLAIAGALLGKEVKFHRNSYFKCGAVYEYSMRERFPKVEWMG